MIVRDFSTTKFPHLLLGGTYKRRLSESEIRTAFPLFARAIGMTPIEEPVVFCKEHGWGPSFVGRFEKAIQPLAESHAILHYWQTEQVPNGVFVEVFTCQPARDWNETRVLDAIRSAFHISQVLELQVVWRGLDLPSEQSSPGTHSG